MWFNNSSENNRLGKGLSGILDGLETKEIELRNRAILEALRLQSRRVPVPMILAILVIAMLAYGDVPLLLGFLWLSTAIVLQLIRYLLLHRWSAQHSVNSNLLLRKATILSLVNGLVLGSSVFFFPVHDAADIAIQTMILVGIASGTVSTSHGYPPIFITFVLVNLVALALGWLFLAGDAVSVPQKNLVACMVLLFGVVLYATARDIFNRYTEIFSANARMEEALNNEKEANAAKTRFLASASHDLRQPLHALSFLSSALSMRELDNNSGQIAKKMEETIKDLSHELDSLLDLSKLDAGIVATRPEVFQVNQSVQKLVKQHESVAEQKELQITCAYESNSRVFTDRILYERVLRNLFDNAIKFTDNGVIKVRVFEDDDICHVAFEDSGPGIPDDEIPRIREEFYQLRNPERDRQKGLGLGLSIVSRLTDLLHANLSIASELGQGSTFTLSMASSNDMAVSRPESEPDTDAADLAVKLEGIRVILVEDDVSVRFGTRSVLEGSGLIVDEAESTVQAIQVVTKYPPDIALVDLRLPNGDSGFRAVEALKKIDSSLPIILISGETAPDKLRQATNLGCSLLIKPVDVKLLLSEIARALPD